MYKNLKRGEDTEQIGVIEWANWNTGRFPAVLLYIGDDTMTYFWNIIISLVITMVSTAVITFILTLKYENRKEETGEQAPVLEKTEANAVYAPVKGSIVTMEKIPDPTFSAGVLGWTMGIEPSDGTVYAPFQGKIEQTADTGHAVGLVSEDGLEVLIHVGVDTVEMGGTGFDIKVKEGDEVKAGQMLMTFDRKAIADAGHPDVAVVIVLNADDYQSVELAAEGAVEAGTKIIQAAK